ncbi:MAG: hypothetical protein WC528_03690 [Patescibacteria group bacterium]
MNINDLPAEGFPDGHKHFAGIIALVPQEAVIGDCPVIGCGGQVSRFTAGVRPLGSDMTTPHVWQRCNRCQNSIVLSK